MKVKAKINGDREEISNYKEIGIPVDEDGSVKGYYLDGFIIGNNVVTRMEGYLWEI